MSTTSSTTTIDDTTSSSETSTTTTSSFSTTTEDTTTTTTEESTTATTEETTTMTSSVPAPTPLFNGNLESTPPDERQLNGPGLRGGWDLDAYSWIDDFSENSLEHGIQIIATYANNLYTFKQDNVDLAEFSSNTLSLSFSYQQYDGTHPCQAILDTFAFEASGTSRVPWVTKTIDFIPVSESGTLQWDIICDSFIVVFWDNIAITEATLSGPTRFFNGDFEDTPIEERAVLGPGLRGGWSIGEQTGIFRPDPVTLVHGQCALVTLDQPQSTFERYNVDLSGYAANSLILSYSYYQQFYPISCNVNVKFFDTAIDTFTMPSNIGVWVDRWIPFTPAGSSGTLRFEVACDGPGARIWWDNIGIRGNTVA
ncbi:hypothetical protein LTR64_002364 [Lithohypha guttulata]|uniref:uncharacterized protein n=1 Tax=Lithohypha guttulata TaxID=1690604 RepID=UPI002DDE907A|nr:hypothetical protein LTR51_001412 [Lithohypha guttulata]